MSAASDKSNRIVLIHENIAVILAKMAKALVDDARSLDSR